MTFPPRHNDKRNLRGRRRRGGVRAVRDLRYLLFRRMWVLRRRRRRGGMHRIIRARQLRISSICRMLDPDRIGLDGGVFSFVLGVVPGGLSGEAFVCCVCVRFGVVLCGNLLDGCD
jgi:hypothetical protein